MQNTAKLPLTCGIRQAGVGVPFGAAEKVRHDEIHAAVLRDVKIENQMAPAPLQVCFGADAAVKKHSLAPRRRA